MQEFARVLLEAGWVAYILGLFSVLNTGIFGYVYLSLWKMEKSLDKRNQDHSSDFDDTKRSETHWEESTHSLVLGISWIGSLAGLSTLVGLFGTVLGIQKSFREMQVTGDTGIHIFAGGVSFALSTTILGLGIAIMSYFLLQICKTKLAGLEKNYFQNLREI